ncbi:unnamed protein product [Merluccius merluccius]
MKENQNQMKENQMKENQMKENQMKENQNQMKENQMKENQMKENQNQMMTSWCRWLRTTPARQRCRAKPSRGETPHHKLLWRRP